VYVFAPSAVVEPFESKTKLRTGGPPEGVIEAMRLFVVL
jgi:hypothetical protein